MFYRRTGGFERNEVSDGYVIYDALGEKVHFLNLTAASVYEFCDGRSGLDSIAAAMAGAFGLAAAPRAEIEACLASLIAKGLIETIPAPRSQ